MITVIKNIEVYSPEYLGVRDVVLVDDKIEGVYENVKIPSDFIKINIINGDNNILLPGFIDSHVHIMGGGGEGGFKTRTPELQLTEITKAGITTLIGCLGTDDVCRNMETLLAKAHALDEEGITTYCYTGSYQVPVKTVTGSVKSDLMLLDKVLGVGEIAISDHRSSQPTYEQFSNVIAQARVGGLLSGKAGIVDIHMGDGAKRLDYLFEVVENTEIPPDQMLPTHVNRNDELFDIAMAYVKKGGFIDLTTSFDVNHMEESEIRASEGLKIALDSGLPIEHITFSSDGNGSMPIFNEKRELIGLGICSVASLFDEVRNAINQYNIPIDKAIKVITSNVADLFKLHSKGRIEENKDADLILVDKESLEINTVIAKGKVLINNKKVSAKGTFEKQ